MNDLISRQSVIDLLKKSASRDIEEVVITEKHINLIKDMPCAYDVEKVVAELEEAKMIYFLTYANTNDKLLDFAYCEVANAIDKAIGIVKGEWWNEKEKL